MYNRKIKFRVWNSKTKSWVHGPGEEVNLFGEIILLDEFMRGVSIKELDDCIALQYTGLLDKHGKEIYEGDILKCINRVANQYIEVKFEDGCFLIENRTFKEFTKSNDIEVARNILENRGLLKC